MRALHGRGLCLWRLGQVTEAREVFVSMLALNPNDNQGARFLLADLEAGLSWEESLARHGEQICYHRFCLNPGSYRFSWNCSRLARFRLNHTSARLPK